MNSVRTVLLVNLIFLVAGLTPVYPATADLAQKITRPAAAFLSFGNQRLLGAVRFIFRLPVLDRENKDLKNQLRQTMVWPSQLKQLQKENELLRSQLNLKSVPGDQRLVLAKVLGQQEKGNLVVLNVGKNQGLSLENPVTLSGALLGQVVEVSDFQAKMRLTVSPESHWEVKSSDFLARGEVQGSFGTQLKLSKVLPSQTLKAGQELLELDHGLLVGKVRKVEKEGAKIFKEAEVEAPYDPNLLDQVFVLVE